MSRSPAAVVLAGGASRRMGRDKAGLDVGGRPLLAHVTARLRRRCDPVLVVAAPDSPAYRSQADAQPDLTWVTDEDPGVGPLGALAAGLAAARTRGVDEAFVCAVDMPLVGPALVDELLVGLRPGDDAVIAVDRRRRHPLAGIYRTALASRVAALAAAGERRLGAALDALTVHEVIVTDPDWLTNVNAPEDLHRLRDHRIGIP